MVLIDTGVWIDFLAGRETPEVHVLIGLLDREESVAFSGIVLQELMQGCSNDAQSNAIEMHFASFIEIFPRRSTYRLAAKIFRDCRRKAFTIRSSVDCLIAACALEHDCFLHHKDRDFTFIEQVCGLKIWRE
ncbi:MAG: type II toxin-antitoxin system VapC family toxin [Verrucomicrobiales bacterium]